MMRELGIKPMRSAIFSILAVWLIASQSPVAADERVLEIKAANLCQRSHENVTGLLMKYPGVRTVTFSGKNTRLRIGYDDRLTDADGLKTAFAFLSEIAARKSGAPV